MHTRGHACLYRDEDEPSPAQHVFLDLRVLWEFLLFSVTLQTALRVTRSLQRELGLGGILCPHWFGQRQCEGKKVSFCGDWGFLTEVDIILCEDSPESRQGHKAGSVCIPGVVCADADMGRSVLSWPHTLAFWRWPGWAVWFFFFQGWPKHLLISTLWLLFSVIWGRAHLKGEPFLSELRICGKKSKKRHSSWRH